MEKRITLSKKEERLRQFILNSNVFLVTLKIGLPIAFFQSLNQIFRIFDSFMAAGINSSAASMVAYFGQINLILGGIGLGLATGSSLKISHAYGQGDYGLVKKRISSLLTLTALICISLGLLIVPLATPFLRLIGTPVEFISSGRTFFLLEFYSTLVMFFNSVYIAIERSQGNSKRILYINLLAMAVKFSLTAFGVYVLEAGVAFLAFSTLISQLMILGIGCFNLRGKSEVFRFSFKDISLKKEIILPMLIISLPIMFERSAFHAGKAIVNGMVIFYGPLVVGALGISNLITGASTSPQNGMQDATVSIMAQNRGAGNVARSFRAFRSVLVLNLTLAALMFIPSWIFAPQVTGIFAIGDPDFHLKLITIFRYDVWSIWPLAIFSSVMALLFGFGFTKTTFILNACRLFLFRIPILWYMQHFTDRGYEVAGQIMIISNILVAALAVLVAFRVIFVISKESGVPFWESYDVQLKNKMEKAH